MEVKPGYKQTEVGVIPEDWECQLLGDDPATIWIASAISHATAIS